MYCSKCGNKIEGDQLFCGQCGNKVNTIVNSQNTKGYISKEIKSTLVFYKEKIDVFISKYNINKKYLTIRVCILFFLLIILIANPSVNGSPKSVTKNLFKAIYTTDIETNDKCYDPDYINKLYFSHPVKEVIRVQDSLNFDKDLLTER